MLKNTLLLALALVGAASAFTVPTAYDTRTPTFLTAESNNNNNEREEKLKQLGFSDSELQRKDSDFQQPTVRVDLIQDVDPITLTAIGFTLIAANFLIFANMGDGGIAGLVATAINLSQQ